MSGGAPGAAQTITAAVPGGKRVELGAPSEDAVVTLEQGSCSLVALADGAGSQPLGGLGARIAAHCAIEALAEYLRRDRVPALGSILVGGILAGRLALKGMTAAANHHQEHVKFEQLATTLTLAVVTPQEVGVASVGDGVHILRGRDGALSLAAMAADTEIANHTDFLTAPDLESKISIDVRPAAEVESVLLSSDGLETQLLGRRDGDRWALPLTVNGLIDAPALDGWGAEEFERMLESDLIRDQSDDDCTLALVRLGVPAGEGEVELDGLALRPAGSLATGREAWVVRGCSDLLAVELGPAVPAAAGIARRSTQVWDRAQRHPPVGWPIRRLGERLALMPRLPGARRIARKRILKGPRSRRKATAEAVRACVEAVHTAGVAHGELSLECFAIQADGAVTLCDPGPGMFEVGDREPLVASDLDFLESLGS